MIVVSILLRNRNFCTQENNFHNSQKHDFDLILIALDWYTNFSSIQFGWIFEVTEVFESYRLLQTVLFLTDSVFYVLFAYFDASMSSIGGYEP